MFDIHYVSMQSTRHEDQIMKFYRAVDERIASVNDFIALFESDASARPRVFLLDEADQFVIAESEHREELFSAMRKLKDEGRAYFIMAGYWHFYEECLDYTSPLYNFGDRILIKSLDRASAADLITGPMKRLGIRYESETLMDRILDGTNCRADLIQMVCSKILENLPKIGRRPLTDEDFDHAVNTHEMRDHLRSPLQPSVMTEKERLIVYANIRRGRFTHREVLEFFDESGIALSSEEFSRACRKLELTNLIDVEGDEYKYNTQLFRDVLVRSDPDTVVESLKREIS